MRSVEVIADSGDLCDEGHIQSLAGSAAVFERSNDHKRYRYSPSTHSRNCPAWPDSQHTVVCWRCSWRLRTQIFLIGLCVPKLPQVFARRFHNPDLD